MMPDTEPVNYLITENEIMQPPRSQVENILSLLATERMMAAEFYMRGTPEDKNAEAEMYAAMIATEEAIKGLAPLEVK